MANTLTDRVATAVRRERLSVPGHCVIALLGYTVLTLVVTFPIVLHLGDRSIGPHAGGDDSWAIWNLWVFRQAVNGGHDPAYTHTIYALLPSVQEFVESPANAIIGWFLQIVLTPLTTYNVLMLLGFVLGGLMTYLLVGEFVEDRFACFVAGVLYTFSTYHFARAAGHLGLATLQWMPFCAWRVWALWRRPTVTNAVLAGVGMALVTMSFVYYLSYFLMLFVGLFLLGKLLTDRRWLTRPHNLRMGVLACLVAAIVALPFLIDYVRLDPEGKAATREVAQESIGVLGSDALAFVLPSPANPLVGGQTATAYARMKTAFSPIENAVFLGYGTLALGLAALAFRRNRTRATGFWLVFGVSGLLLSLGTDVHVAGRTLFSWPLYRLVFGWPLVANFRAPNRLIVVPLLAFAVLSAFTLGAWGASVRRDAARIAMRVFTVLLLVAAVGTQILWAFPYPSGPLPMPALYAEIGADPEDALLLDLPLMPGAAADMYYQTAHHKRLVNGYVSRPTQQMFASVLDLPYAVQFDTQSSDQVIDLATHQGDIYPMPGFADAMRENRIKYVVLHRRGDALRYATMRGALQEYVGAPFYDNDAEGLTAWRIPLTPPDATQYHFSLGTGWIAGMSGRNGAPERFVQQDGQVRITAPRAESVTFLATLNPLLASRTVQVMVNGATVKTVGVKAATQVRVEDVPLRPGPNLVLFHLLDGCVSPQAADPSTPDSRCLGVGVQNVQLITPQGFLGNGRPQPRAAGEITYGSGWLKTISDNPADPVGAVEQDGQIIVTAPQAVTANVSFIAFANFKPRTMELRLNGVTVQTVPFRTANAPQDVRVQVALQPGMNLLEIHAVEGCYRPTTQDQPMPDPRCFGFYIERLQVAAQ